MIKNSTELIKVAKNTLRNMLKRSIERDSQPSYLEMFYAGYSHGWCDANDKGVDIKDPLSDWHYIELEGNPPTDDKCAILVQCDGYTEIEMGWYDESEDRYHLGYEPRGMRKIMAWHMLPVCPEDYEQRMNVYKHQIEIKI